MSDKILSNALVSVIVSLKCYSKSDSVTQVL